MTEIKVWDRAKVYLRDSSSGGGTTYLVHAIDEELALLEDNTSVGLVYVVYDLEHDLASSQQVVGRMGPASRVAAMQEIASYGWWRQVPRDRQAMILVVGSTGVSPVSDVISEDERWQRTQVQQRRRRRLDQTLSRDEWLRQKRMNSALRHSKDA